MGLMPCAMMQQLCSAAIRADAGRKRIICIEGTPMPGSTAPFLSEHAQSWA